MINVLNFGILQKPIQDLSHICEIDLLFKGQWSLYINSLTNIKRMIPVKIVLQLAGNDLIQFPNLKEETMFKYHNITTGLVGILCAGTHPY